MPVNVGWGEGRGRDQYSSNWRYDLFIQGKCPCQRQWVLIFRIPVKVFLRAGGPTRGRHADNFCQRVRSWTPPPSPIASKWWVLGFWGLIFWEHGAELCVPATWLGKPGVSRSRFLVSGCLFPRPERCDCSIVMLKRLGEFRRSVPGFDARRGRVFGTAENTGLICNLSSRRWETRGGARWAGRTAPKLKKESPNFNNKDECLLTPDFCAPPIGWALWSAQHWLMQLAAWLISSGELAKSVWGKNSFSVWKWNTHETLGRKSNAVQVILLPVFVRSHLESKLRVSTVIQWQDRSTGCN